MVPVDKVPFQIPNELSENERPGLPQTSQKDQGKVDFLPEDLEPSAEDVSRVPSYPGNQFAFPEKLKWMSLCGLAIPQDESDDREIGTSSERGDKRSLSSWTLCSNSGMPSLSLSDDREIGASSGKGDRRRLRSWTLSSYSSMISLSFSDEREIGTSSGRGDKRDLRSWTLSSYSGMTSLSSKLWVTRTLCAACICLGMNPLHDREAKAFSAKNLTPMGIEAEKTGEMRLALQYVPEPISGKELGEVHIYLMECIGLPCLQGKHLNALVKCIFLPDKKSGQKKKTVGGESNSVSIHHTFICDGFLPDDLNDICAELTVWDHHRLTNQFLGGLRLGFGKGNSFGIEVDWMDSTPAEISLWERMVKSPNTWVEDILPLRIISLSQTK